MPQVVETHISWNFFTDDRVFKLLKPVTFDFVDFSTPELRVAAATTEIELNRRLSPDVYLGSADVVENGEVVDKMIVTRRLPDDRRLSRLLTAEDRSEGENCLRGIARTIAEFHARATVHIEALGSTREVLLANWRDNFAALEPYVGEVIDEADHVSAKTLVEAYLAPPRSSLFEQRLASGYVRDGHGDLIADDIFCLSDGPRILDCLAFREDWRIGDVLADIGFLAMDVERLAGPAVAQRFMDWYHEFTNEAHPASLESHYIAYRAHVRAKVAALRFGQGDAASAGVVQRYHSLVLRHLREGRIRLILIGGGPGTGKSTLAAGVGERLSYPVLRSDEIRKNMAGKAATDDEANSPGEGIYTAEWTQAAYDEMLREAALLLESGVGVVLDASWGSDHFRSAARKLGTGLGVEVVELECAVCLDVAKERIVARSSHQDNISDATSEVADHWAASREPWPEALNVSTAQPLEAVLSFALQAIGATD